jgi:hypothetical protein
MAPIFVCNLFQMGWNQVNKTFHYSLILSCPATGLNRPVGIRWVKAPDFLDVRLYSQEFSWYSFLEAESTPGPRKKSPVTPLGIDPETSRLVAQCLNHYATPGPILSTLYRSMSSCCSVCLFAVFSSYRCLAAMDIVRSLMLGNK